MLVNNKSSPPVCVPYRLSGPDNRNRHDGSLQSPRRWFHLLMWAGRSLCCGGSAMIRHDLPSSFFQSPCRPLDSRAYPGDKLNWFFDSQDRGTELHHTMSIINMHKNASLFFSIMVFHPHKAKISHHSKTIFYHIII